MPIDFAEPSPHTGTGNRGNDDASTSKQQPLHLEGQCVPQLIRKVGDVKSNRIEIAAVERYLDRHTLVWDRDLLHKMFEEADYKKAGFLDSPSLVAALSGRFPKRKMTADWRKLAAILLDLPTLVLLEDMPRLADRAGLANDIWTAPPKSLPKAKRQVHVKEVSGEWKTLSGSGRLGSAGSSPGTGPLPDALDALLQSHSSGGDATMLTTGGLKSATPIAAEQAINASLAETGRSTFAGVREYNDFTTGLQLTSKLSVDPVLLATLSASGRLDDIPGSTAPTVRSVRAWNAALPPSAITMPQSALGTLRHSIRSTTASKPEFESQTRRLATTDHNKTLGLPREDVPLSRVEPVRDTKVLYNADYVTWGGANGTDRAAPDRWVNDYPASASAGTERRYPWG